MMHRGQFLLNSTTRAYRTIDEEAAGGGGGGRGAGGGGGMAGEGGGGLGSCEDWQEAQHTLFQLANLCMAVSFLTPSSFRFHLLFLRCMLLLSFGLLAVWGALFMCMADVLAWNLLFFLLDLGHIVWLVYRHLPARLPQSHAALYTKVFKPVRVGQAEFLDLVRLGRLQPVTKGGLYAMEGLTPCAQRLSILLKGRLKVTYQRLFLHYIEVNQFVDAAEYDSLTLQQDNSDKHQVSIAATEDSVLLTWEYPALQEYLSNHPFLDTLFHYLIGKDVCSQLYAIQEQLLQAQDYLTTNTTTTSSSSFTPPAHRSSALNLRSSLAVGHHNSFSSPFSTPPRLPPDPPSSSAATRDNEQDPLRGGEVTAAVWGIMMTTCSHHTRLTHELRTVAIPIRTALSVFPEDFDS
ncbi:LOW QUALITY PROTEIN: popeye domain-containing protein 1-like [Babylonia areolata]|uniref:LOW QUALITY PROTEIN: popeye domain-containing protein 1-like n=1 Tax=Babylonia areolata TaxID=304850 RepID=UPI003FD4B5A5